MSTPSSPVIYPVPEAEAPATDYALTVDGQPVFTHRARVSACPFNQVWPGYQRPLEQTEIASFAAWDMAVPVAVVVKSTRPVQTVRVRPCSAGIVPQVEGDTLCFTVARPGQYTVEVNGMHQALHLFANPPAEAAPDPRDPNVVYFGPGVHTPGLIRVTSGQTVYLAGGAVVHGAILAEKAENICIRGRGILDGSRIDRLDGLTALVCLYDCENVRVEGITLRDSPVFTVVPLASRQVHIRNVKVIGNWRYNSDGINFISCRDCRVEDCFIRAFDDCLCIKGYETFGPLVYRLQLVNGQWDGFFTVDGGVTRRSFADLVRGHGVYPCPTTAIHDIRIRRCVLWNDWGRALEIGAETAVDDIRDIAFEDCDVIHAADVAMDVQNCDRALVRNVLFRDIRVEMDDAPMRPVGQQHPGQVYAEPANGYLPQLLALGIQKGYCSFDAERGRVEDIRFENVAAFEREYGTYDFGARLAEFIQFKADILVLAIGENVPPLATEAERAAFRQAVVALLARVTQDRRPALYVRSPFWPDPVKEAVLRQICQDMGGTFVDLSGLGAVEANYARSERQFPHDGVAIHPGDRGMAAIAEAIWKAMRTNQTRE